MPVKYLSQEWIDAYNDALAGDAVRGALKGKNATIQMVISDAPEGEIRYWLRIEDGGAAAGLGGPGGPGGRVPVRAGARGGRRGARPGRPGRARRHHPADVRDVGAGQPR